MPSAQTGRGIKRPHSMLMSKSKVSYSERDQNVLDQVVPCRPWDRGDLMKRLATFKSMTWFAKPKVCHRIYISNALCASFFIFYLIVIFHAAVSE